MTKRSLPSTPPVSRGTLEDVYQEDFEESWPYCTCDEDPMEDESASNTCSSCGKALT